MRGSVPPSSQLSHSWGPSGSPFQAPVGAFTLALCTCKLTHPHSHTHTHTHMHTHATHTQAPVFLPLSAWVAEPGPISTTTLCSQGPLGPLVPKTQPQAWHTLAFPGFEKRVTEQGEPQRQVIQSVEYVCVRLRYSTNLMFCSLISTLSFRRRKKKLTEKIVFFIYF